MACEFSVRYVLHGARARHQGNCFRTERSVSNKTAVIQSGLYPKELPSPRAACIHPQNVPLRRWLLSVKIVLRTCPYSFFIY